jgi:hypothetical protein
MTNPIQQVILSNIRMLVERSKAAREMSHRSTIGTLIESYITNFLKEQFPTGVSVTSGIICDSQGNTSRQIDLVVTLDSSLPFISMKEGIALIPSESALLAIEIKSTLTTQALKQVEMQNKSISKLVMRGQQQNGKPIIIPTMLVAFDTQITNNKVEEWMNNNGNTISCCVISNYLVKRNNLGIVEIINGFAEPSFIETLQLVVDLQQIIIVLRDNRDLKTDLKPYLLS